MDILAIETSCDDTAAAVVRNGRQVLSSKTLSQITKHQVYGGVVPEIASRCHSEAIVSIVDAAIEESGVFKNDIDAVAVTYSPGLIGSLLVGVNFAKGFSFALKKPLIAVHHLRAHIASNYISYPCMEPPFICLVVSGGHTHIVAVNDYTCMNIIGKTRDDAAGETFDKAARCMGMPYPGGVHLDIAANEGNPLRYNFPHPGINGSMYDFSFSGLKTSIINQIHKMKQNQEDIPINDLSASFRKAVVECLVSRFIKAAENLGFKKLAIAGGVSANSLLRSMLKEECLKRGWEFYKPDLKLCGDNAAMVGAQGYYEFLEGNTAGLDLNASACRSVNQG